MTTMCFTDFYQPFKEDELEQSTEVQIIYPAEPKPVILMENTWLGLIYICLSMSLFLFWLFGADIL